MSDSAPRLRIQAVPQHVALARGFVSAALQVLEVPGPVVEAVRLGVSELVTALVEIDAGAVVVEIGVPTSTVVVTSEAGLPEIVDPAAAVLQSLDGVHLASTGSAWTLTWEGR